MNNTSNQQVKDFIAAANAIRDERTESDDMWIGSPFAWVQPLSSRTKGAVAEKIVEAWAKGQGFSVGRGRSSDTDRIIHGHRIEIKYSREWAKGTYRFQQIRDQQYDYIFLLGLRPQDVQAWLIPKSYFTKWFSAVYDPDAISIARSRGESTWPEYLSPQHGGSKKQPPHDTLWLTDLPADHPPHWLSKFGGSLEEVKRLLLEMDKGSHVPR
jgi:hypothetical protein